MARLFGLISLSAKNIIPIRRLGLQFAPVIQGADRPRPNAFALNSKRRPRTDGGLGQLGMMRRRAVSRLMGWAARRHKVGFANGNLVNPTRREMRGPREPWRRKATLKN